MGRDGMHSESNEGQKWFEWNIFDPWRDRFRAVMTTRNGGVSGFPEKSLNLGHHVDDSEENLHENRRRISSAIGMAGIPWTVAEQVHGVRIGEATTSRRAPLEACDAIHVASPGSIAGILLADCLPVVVYDPERHACVIGHAGWRGTLSGIAGKAVERMVSGGSRTEDLVAAAGPGIGPCCYEVSEDVAGQFLRIFDEGDGVVTKNPGSKPHVDLETANLIILRRSGITEDRLGRGGFCTACLSGDFFSYRKERGRTGRHAALAALV